MMRIEERFDVACSPELTYRELNSVADIGQCIAGVQEVTVINGDESRWKLQVLAGFMAITVSLDAQITERRPNERIAFAAVGQDVALTGYVNISSSAPMMSTCEVVIDADIGGPLGPLADVMARGPQEALIAETIKNIRARLTALAGADHAGGAGDSSAAPSDGRQPPTAGTAADIPDRPRTTVTVAGMPSRDVTALVAGGMLVVLGYVLGRRANRRSG